MLSARVTGRSYALGRPYRSGMCLLIKATNLITVRCHVLFPPSQTLGNFLKGGFLVGHCADFLSQFQVCFTRCKSFDLALSNLYPYPFAMQHHSSILLQPSQDFSSLVLSAEIHLHTIPITEDNHHAESVTQLKPSPNLSPFHPRLPPPQKLLYRT